MLKTLQLKFLFWIAVATWAVGLFVMGVPLSEALFKPSGIVLAAVTAVVALFDKWVWKWAWLHPWFVSTPNLNGTYKGYICPLSKVADDSGAPSQIEAFLSIHQTFSSTTVRLYTVESESVSICSDLRASEDNHWQLRYIYENVPGQRVRERSPIHFGGVGFAIDGIESSRLSGSYWTDRQTNGEIAFERVSRVPSRSFKEASEKGK